MGKPSRPFIQLLPFKDQQIVRIEELMGTFEELMTGIITNAERKLPNYDPFEMEARPDGLPDLQRLASNLGVKVRQRFGRGFDLDPDNRFTEKERERNVSRRAIETAIAFYKLKGLAVSIDVIGYIMQLVIDQTELNTTDYLTFFPDPQIPVGFFAEIAPTVIATGNGANTVFFGSLPNTNIIPGTLKITAGTDTFLDNQGGELTGPGTGFIDYESGIFQVNFNNPPGAGVPVTAEYNTAEPGVGDFFFRSPHLLLEIDWIGSNVVFNFNEDFSPVALLEDTRFALEDTRPAHVTFDMGFVIGLRQVFNLNAETLMYISLCIPCFPNPDFDMCSIGDTCFSHDASTFIRARANDTRLDMVINDTKVADVSAAGIRISGLSSFQVSPLTNQPAPWVGGDGIIFDDPNDTLFFGYWTGGSGASKTWTPFMSINGAGDMECIGLFAEESKAGLIRHNQCSGSVTEGPAPDFTFFLSNSPLYVDALQFTNSDNTLHLFARLTEGTSFGTLKQTLWSANDFGKRVEILCDPFTLFFVVDSNRVAEIGSDGILKLVGEIQELTFTGNPVQVPKKSPLGLIEEVGDKIGFAVIESGEARTVATLDKDGNLAVHETIETPGIFPTVLTTFPDRHWQYDDPSLHFSLDKLATILRFEKTDVSGNTNAILNVNEVNENETIT